MWITDSGQPSRFNVYRLALLHTCLGAFVCSQLMSFTLIRTVEYWSGFKLMLARGRSKFESLTQLNIVSESVIQSQSDFKASVSKLVWVNQMKNGAIMFGVQTLDNLWCDLALFPTVVSLEYASLLIETGFMSKRLQMESFKTCQSLARYCTKIRPQLLLDLWPEKIILNMT